MRDFMGKEFKEGDTIVYPSVSGSHLWMNEGRVVSVSEEKLMVSPIRSQYSKKRSTPVRLLRPDRAVIV